MSSVSAPSGGGASAASAPSHSSAPSGGSNGGSTSVSGTFNVQKTDSSGATTSASGSFNVSQNGGMGKPDTIGKNSVEPHNAGDSGNSSASSKAHEPEQQLYNALCKALGVDPSEDADGADGDSGGQGSDGPQGSQGGSDGGSQSPDSIGGSHGSGGQGSNGGNGIGGNDNSRGLEGAHGSGGHGSYGNGGSHGSNGSHGTGGAHGTGGSHGSNGTSNSHNNNNNNATDGSQPGSQTHSRPAGPDGSGTWHHGSNMNNPVKSYQNTGSAPNKNRVNNALDSMGATNKEKSLVMAMGMQEDHNFSAHDKGKDGKGDSQNYSAFNLNKYELRKLGYKGDPSRLNDSKNIGEVSKLILKGMRNPNIGVKKLMDMTRGGETAANGGGDRGDLDRWRNGQMASANRILAAGPSAFTDSSRYVADAGYR